MASSYYGTLSVWPVLWLGEGRASCLSGLAFALGGGPPPVCQACPVETAELVHALTSLWLGQAAASQSLLADGA